MTSDDWERWARTIEELYRPADRTWLSLFADDAEYVGPHMGPVNDMHAVHDVTESMFADFGWRLTSLRGAEDFAAFEYEFTGAYIGPGAPEGGIPIVAHGACIVDVDQDGLVCRMLEYARPGEVEGQISAWLASPAGG